MAADSLSSLLTSSKALTSHLSRPDLPQLNLSLDQIEAQSRRLVSRQPGAATDSGRAYVEYDSNFLAFNRPRIICQKLPACTSTC